MKKEIASLHKNNTWKLITLLKDQKVLWGKWVYKKKTTEASTQYKAWWVIKEFMQWEGINYTEIYVSVTPKGDHLLSQRYSELHLNTPSKPLRWLSKKCRRQDLNSQPQQPLPGLIPSLMSQTARFYARLYYHAQTRAHNLLRQKVITYWVSAIVSYISTVSVINKVTTKIVIAMTAIKRYYIE